jgi:hypothetical protein
MFWAVRFFPGRFIGAGMGKGRILDIRSGRWATAVIFSIAYGVAIFAIGILLVVVRLYLSTYMGFSYAGIDSNLMLPLRRISIILMITVIAPVLESLLVIFIYIVLIGLLLLPHAMFVLVTTVAFAMLHEYPLNGGVIFMLFSIQYLFMCAHYSRAIAFWSVVTSHAVNNALAIVLALILTAST